MDQNEQSKRVNCFRCIHYTSTWIPKFPRGCKFFGFKSSGVPSDVIFETTGERCSVFEERPKKNAPKQTPQ